MKALLEIMKIVSMLVALGAAFWAALAVISSDPAFGGQDSAPALKNTGAVFLASLSLYIFAAFFQKRLT